MHSQPDGKVPLQQSGQRPHTGQAAQRPRQCQQSACTSPHSALGPSVPPATCMAASLLPKQVLRGLFGHDRMRVINLACQTYKECSYPLLIGSTIKSILIYTGVSTVCLIKQCKIHQLIETKIHNAWAEVSERFECNRWCKPSAFTEQQKQAFDNCRLCFRVGVLCHCRAGP